MTDPKRTNTTLRRMVAARDRKLAALTAENRAARAELVEAVRLAKQLARENAALRNNIEVLQRPHHVAKREETALHAIRMLAHIKPRAQEIMDLIGSYEHWTRRTL